MVEATGFMKVRNLDTAKGDSVAAPTTDPNRSVLNRRDILALAGAAATTVFDLHDATGRGRDSSVGHRHDGCGYARRRHPLSAGSLR